MPNANFLQAHSQNSQRLRDCTVEKGALKGVSPAGFLSTGSAPGKAGPGSLGSVAAVSASKGFCGEWLFLRAVLSGMRGSLFGILGG